ncbi:tRNA preQ1(34) S-adenosylmethionine ribosyltransferase-isomerase [Gammaproteobacteria bacterium]
MPESLACNRAEAAEPVEPRLLCLSDFQYDLPPDRIALTPAAVRSESRLLCLDGATGQREDRHFWELADQLRPADLLVFNDTQVLKARLWARKATGGRVEILIERLLSPQRALTLLRTGKPPRMGTHLFVEEGPTLRIEDRHENFWVLSLTEGDFDSLMARVGHVPLPPYIPRPDDAHDADRYQTVYARQPGAVAAPTAGLHFDAALLATLAARGVETAFLTLHVGSGTFQPVRVENLAQHRMHAEWLSVDEGLCQQVAATRRRGGRVVAVGTTSVRALETAAAGGILAPYQGDTRLFIRPGFQFRVVDALVTNFHLPGSTLLMLVAAFAGVDRIQEAYRHAVEAGYRFFSYGDAMFLTRNESNRLDPSPPSPLSLKGRGGEKPRIQGSLSP